ncbi:hypothetical protein B296_00007188 [Ensete ventricosum]|uniref:DUF547 domain-containing protein n=1 Tax=Ensete ventricosum TaxID=4639 RepID=A0A427A3E5_ENSVE|nr:hypothetical protein B296_00007188 [Ensete ventricosum]
MNLKVTIQVQKLQQELQEEIDLHVALANAVAHNAGPLLNSPSKLPDKVCSNALSLLNAFYKTGLSLHALSSVLCLPSPSGVVPQASYIIGGQSFSAAEIEFVVLKMKPPGHRPQLALALSLHKLRISEEHRKYSIDGPEPLLLFALSCGMYSSPAVSFLI